MTVDSVLAESLRRSPLGHLSDYFAQRSTGGVRLRELPFLTMLNLQLDPDGAAAARIAAALGTPLPTVPNTVAGARDTVADAGDLRILWLGPTEWLVTGPDGSAEDTSALLREALADEFSSLVDVSANRTTLELSGPDAREVLEKGCSLDLHPRAFGPGRCAQTLLSKVNVVLDQTDSEPAYRLLVRGSFAQYLADWLLDAMEEFSIR
ncbi:sarcosine oxidase subunit gamma [Catenulispora sp. GP43]|uniref:sarcosine oxidase subunit gamma n=1 Tax=Catenulispora sp. GP43 TaxID=3156263 RepID=UPI0035190F32